MYKKSTLLKIKWNKKKSVSNAESGCMCSIKPLTESSGRGTEICKLETWSKTGPVV